jgi:Domain of unknown function (DUF6471)
MQGAISSNMRNEEISEKTPPKVEPWKDKPITVEYETRAKNLLRGELRRKGVTSVQLAEKLAEIGVQETERNLNNKISRGGFTAAFMLQCFEAIGISEIIL